MTGSVVVDASLAVKWIVNEVHSERASGLARAWARLGTQPVAPYLMPVEVSNALHKRVTRREISLEGATRLLDGLLGAGIELREPLGLHRRAVELAVQLRLDAVYDAHYLALAESLGCEFWTADERLYRAVSPSLAWVRWLGTFSAQGGS